MKKVINLTILSAIILSLIFIPTVQTNAASTVIPPLSGKYQMTAKK